MYEINYHELVVSVDIAKLNSADKMRIKKAIEMKLQTQPDLYGKPLRRSLRSNRSLRVGQYRVVYRIRQKEVLIFVIEHRSFVYGKALKRI